MAAPVFRTIALAMVKNEIDIIEPFVRHNIRHLDALIVFDHFSADGTRQVLLQLSREFDRLAVGTYDGDAQDQGHLLTAQFHAFQAKFRADHVLFLDADEFIGLENGANLGDCLNQIAPGVVGLIPWQTYLPDPSLADGPGELLDRFTLRRRVENPPRSKVVLRLDGASANGLRICQGSHEVRTRAGRKMKSTLLTGIHLTHLPVRSLEQLVAKARIGTLTNSLRADRDAARQATQWQRVAALEQSGRMGDGPEVLFAEAMGYAQRSVVGDPMDNAQADRHGICETRRYSDGRRQPAQQLFDAERARLRLRGGSGRAGTVGWLSRVLFAAQPSDLAAMQYLVRKYGRAGIHFDLALAELSGFSTAAPDDCVVHVALDDVLPGPDFVAADFDMLVAQALCKSRRLQADLRVFRRNREGARD